MLPLSPRLAGFRFPLKELRRETRQDLAPPVALPRELSFVAAPSKCQSTLLTLLGCAGKPPMSRKLRIEYPGAMYPVMNRGNRREDIFRDDEDRHVHLSCQFAAGEPNCLSAEHDDAHDDDEAMGLPEPAPGGVLGALGRLCG